jgi:transposase
VDLETGAVVAVTLQPATAGDTNTVCETLAECGEHIREVAVDAVDTEETVNPEGPAELVLDKGYHSNDVLMVLKEVGVRVYCSEPDRGRRDWTAKEKEQRAVYENRRRIRGERGKRLLRQRGERVERSFAHLYETGAMRRTHLRRHENIIKRLLIHASAFNLGLVMRQACGHGTPRGFGDAAQACILALRILCRLLRRAASAELLRTQ